jgi:hypothetical protein
MSYVMRIPFVDFAVYVFEYLLGDQVKKKWVKGKSKVVPVLN